MNQKMFPSVVFFKAGQTGPGIAAALLQASIIGWPVASRMARAFEERSGVQLMLSEFSEKYQLPPTQLMRSGKRFRQTA